MHAPRRGGGVGEGIVTAALRGGFFVCVSPYSGITRRECGDIVCFVNAGIDTLTNDLDKGFQLACDGD